MNHRDRREHREGQIDTQKNRFFSVCSVSFVERFFLLDALKALSLQRIGVCQKFCGSTSVGGLDGDDFACEVRDLTAFIV